MFWEWLPVPRRPSACWPFFGKLFINSSIFFNACFSPTIYWACAEVCFQNSPSAAQALLQQSTSIEVNSTTITFSNFVNLFVTCFTQCLETCLVDTSQFFISLTETAPRQGNSFYTGPRTIVGICSFNLFFWTFQIFKLCHSSTMFVNINWVDDLTTMKEQQWWTESWFVLRFQGLRPPFTSWYASSSQMSGSSWFNNSNWSNKCLKIYVSKTVQIDAIKPKEKLTWKTIAIGIMYLVHWQIGRFCTW